MDRRDLEISSYNQDIDQQEEKSEVQAGLHEEKDFDIKEQFKNQEEKSLDFERIQNQQNQEETEQANISTDSAEFEEDACSIECNESSEMDDFDVKSLDDDIFPNDDEKNDKDDVKKEVNFAEWKRNVEKKKKSGNFLKIAVLFLICSALLGMSIGFGYKWGENYFSSENKNFKDLNDESVSNLPEMVTDKNPQPNVSNAVHNPLNDNTSLADLAENTKKAVVAITSHEITRDYFMGVVEVPTSGTGVIYKISNDRIFIVTNSHVVGEGKTSVKFEHQNEPVDVEFIGRDEVTDVAVLSVKKSDLSTEAFSYIKPIKFSNSDKVRVGDFIMVVGNPLGYDYTTTFGIVSGLNRNTQLTSEDLLIQVDAAVNRGNSGGPLVNMSGELIGIINQKMNQMTAEGIGFAIPANRVMEEIKFLVENQENPSSSQAFLGITGEAIDESAAEYYKLPLGVLVRSTLEDSAAKISGIKEADIIIEADGKRITNMVELQRVISRKKPGDEVLIKILRIQQGEMELKVKLSDKSKFKRQKQE